MDHAEFTLRDPAQARQISLDEYWMPFTPNREFKADPQMVVRAEGMFCGTTAATSSSMRASGHVLRCTPATAGRRSREAVRQAALASSISARRSCAGIRSSFELATARGGAHAGRSQPHLLRQLRLRGGRYRHEELRSPTTRRAARAAATCSSRASAPITASISAASRSRGSSTTGASSAPALPGIAHMRHTHLKDNAFTQGEGAHGVELAEDLQRFVNLYGAENIAACFVEPIAGSTGCLVPPKRLSRSACARSATRTGSCSCSTK